MRAGNYADAVQYYRLAYELSDDEALVSKIELAQRLTDEVYAVDESVKANLFDKAYTHIDNILKIDPTNTYVNTKREQIRVARAEYRSEQFRKSTKGFRGSKERHDILGGIHFEAGANFSQFKPYTEKMTMGYRGKLSYGYYKYFPIIVDVNSTVYGNYQSLGGGCS